MMKLKKKIFPALLALSLLLGGCGAKTEPPSSPPQTAEPSAPAEQPEAPAANREEKAELSVSVEGKTEAVPATLYVGDGYSLYIPDEGWRMEQGVDDGVAEAEWDSTVSEDVQLTVYTYTGYSRTGAMDLFTADHDYVYEDLLGGSGPEDALTGIDAEDQEQCSFFCAQGDGVTYLVAWEYPAEAAEGFGARLAAIAAAFALEE